MKKESECRRGAFPTGNRITAVKCWILLILTLVLILIAIPSKGQKIDSLTLLVSQKYGLERFDVLCDLAYAYMDIDTDYKRGLNCANEALRIAEKFGDSLRIVKAGRVKSYGFGRLGDVDSSIIVSLKILPIATRNNYFDQLKHILNRLGSAYVLIAEYDKALDYYFQSHLLREKYGDKFELSVTFNNIGYVFFKLEDYDKALLYYTRSLNFKNETKNKYDLDILLINLGLCHTYKRNYSEAKDFIDQAFSLCGSNCSNSFIMQASFSLGLIDFGLREFTTAETQFLKSYKLAKELRNERFQLDNIIYLSRINISQNELSLAENYLIEAEKLITTGTPYNLELIKVYRELSKLYQQYKRFDRMAHYQDKYIQLKDSIYGEELTKNLMRVESEYLERENTAKIAAQAKILLLDKEVIFRQRILNALMGIIAILLAFLAFVVIRNNRQKRADNLFLEQKVKERTLELEQSNDALLRLLDERAAVVQKASAEVKSSVATIKGLCSLGLMDRDSSFGDQYAHKITATADQLLRNISRTLKSTR